MTVRFPSSKAFRATCLSLLAWLAVASSACADSPATANPTRFGEWGIDLQSLSTEIRPGDDFFGYVNGGWLTSTSIPEGAAVYSAAWELQERIIEQTRGVVEAAAAGEPPPGTPERRIRDVFLSYRDLARVDQLGLSVIQAELEAILALDSHDHVAAWMGDVRSNSLFHLRVQPPADMRGGYVLSLAQYRATGLGLPDRLYYLGEDDTHAGTRAAYRSYVERTFAAAGVGNAGERADQVLALETAFAEVMWDLARLRQAGAAFRLVPRAALDEVAPVFPWEAFLAARGIDEVETLNIGVGAIAESAALFPEIPVEHWSSYLAFHWINNHVPVLPESFGEAHFDLFSRNLYGTQERPNRDQRAMDFVERHLGADIGQVYVARFFSGEARRRVREIVDYVQRAFRERLETVEWMDQTTRAEAIAKLEAVLFEIGEPQQQPDRSGLQTDPTDLAGNLHRIREQAWAAQRNRIGQPLSRLGDWNMEAHRIGAGYHQQYNKIFLTAGSLQAPFFDLAADPAVQFGSVGHTIAHELGHALDDQGSRFDRNGALREWWTAEARVAYEQRTSALIVQYQQYEPLPGVFLNAEQMIGEIVGDQTGTEIAFHAYQLYAADRHEGDPPLLDGFTGAQRFFMATAQQYRAMATETALRGMALHQTHPPERYRINGVLANFGPWYEAFGVEPDGALYRAPEARIRLW